MGRQKAPPPPKIEIPEPTQLERDIQAQQLELLKRQTQQFDTFTTQQAEDRKKFFELFGTLNDGKPITPEDEQLINDLSNQFGTLLKSGITDGIVGEQLDRNREKSIGNLVERGVLNSTSGERLLGDVERERSRLLADAAQQAELQRLQLQKDFRFNNQNFGLAQAQLLSGVNQQLGALAGQAGNSAASLASNIGGQARNERFARSNVDAQNAQAAYLSQLNNRRSFGGLGSALGGLAGAAAAPFTAGLSLSGGLALGSTLGGLGGSLI